MARKILVSLVSEQTLPNVELIKEFREDIDKYLFISTIKMSSQLKWICDTVELNDFDAIVVNPYDIKDIESKLNEYHFDEAEYILNITCGTKLMTTIVGDFFKNIGAKIYYVTGSNKEYLKVFPAFGERKFKLSKKILLEEYLKAYGFSFKKGSCLKESKVAKDFFSYYINSCEEFLSPILSELRKYRSKSISVDEIPSLSDYIQNSKINLESKGKLSKFEVRYLTGDWFEEYVYCKVKEELNLSKDEIGIGYNLNKENVPNEIDVLFVFQNKLYIIECKTSFYETRQVLVKKNNETLEKNIDKNLLPEIIYKSDALRTKFGLFANTSVFTLGNIKDDNGEILENLKDHLYRAEISRIQIVGRNDVINNLNIRDVFGIKE